MTGLLLRLAGPLQSWGEHSAFTERDTCRFPTRSGLLGMVAATEGRPRTDRLDDYEPLELTIRIDRPGIRLVDFHTVGGGRAREQTVITASGSRRPAGSGTLVSRRHYLADAVFTVAVTGPHPLIDRLSRALAAPVWPPFLGRRSCPPAGPFLLRTTVPDPVTELDRVPLPLPRPRTGSTVPVEFVLEHDPDGSDQEQPVRTELNDVPVSFHPMRRTYRSRHVVIPPPRDLDARLCAGYGIDYLTTLDTYLREG